MTVTMTMSDMTGSATDGPAPRAAGRGPRAGGPKRRTFTDAYRQRVLDEFDALTDPQERGALLRREGLYYSHIEYWRKGAKKTAPAATAERATGRPVRDPAAVESEQLQKENEKLRAELARTKAALEVVGKAHALLAMLSESADFDATQSK